MPYPAPHPPHQSKTDIKISSIWWILVEGVGCLHHSPLGWYRADHPLPECREFDFSKLKWRRTKDRFRSGHTNVSSTRQAQGLDCYSVGCTVVWLRSSGWCAQSPRAVRGLLESLPRNWVTLRRTKFVTNIIREKNVFLNDMNVYTYMICVYGKDPLTSC